MVEDPGLSEGDKRSRLAESLAPPALSIYRKAAQTLGFCVSAEELLSQLGEAFGVACEVEDLLSLFRDTYQEAGEKPSYLARLEDRLNQAVQFGGVPYGDIDRLRLSQYVRG
ncbi:putative paraneoplastic antigen Ma1-like [Apostichopus japonicus]|uniref:Putative paraneoplastic antigen Ma1-like n=1 Tax=Stichopus japonicus TaxID=307972 RepID=A0A2G8KUL2_STIJA|nr:putative paraneoplastic antigen Ma1-like [Apostichopus japonicus]